MKMTDYSLFTHSNGEEKYRCSTRAATIPVLRKYPTYETVTDDGDDQD